MARVVRNPQFNALMKQAIADGLSAVAIAIKEEVKQKVSTPGQGRVYVKPSGRKHRASKPGDPPTVDTGNYRRSIQVDLSERLGTIQRVKVGTNVKVRGKSLGRILEYGNRDIAARPHWRPVLRTFGPKAVRLFTAAAQRRMSRGA